MSFQVKIKNKEGRTFKFASEHLYPDGAVQDCRVWMEQTGHDPRIASMEVSASDIVILRAPRESETCVLRIMGLGQYAYARKPGYNDQFIVGTTYVIPLQDGQLHRAKCVDWFQAGGPKLTVFVFERVPPAGKAK